MMMKVLAGFFLRNSPKVHSSHSPWVKNTFRWPRAYRDEAFKALGRTNRPSRQVPGPPRGFGHAEPIPLFAMKLARALAGRPIRALIGVITCLGGKEVT